MLLFVQYEQTCYANCVTANAITSYDLRLLKLLSLLLANDITKYEVEKGYLYNIFGHQSQSYSIVFETVLEKRQPFNGLVSRSIIRDRFFSLYFQLYLLATILVFLNSGALVIVVPV